MEYPPYLLAHFDDPRRVSGYDGMRGCLLAGEPPGLVLCVGRVGVANTGGEQKDQLW